VTLPYLLIKALLGVIALLVLLNMLQIENIISIDPIVENLLFPYQINTECELAQVMQIYHNSTIAETANIGLQNVTAQDNKIETRESFLISRHDMLHEELLIWKVENVTYHRDIEMHDQVLGNLTEKDFGVELKTIPEEEDDSDEPFGYLDNSSFESIEHMFMTQEEIDEFYEVSSIEFVSIHKDLLMKKYSINPSLESNVTAAITDTDYVKPQNCD